MPSALFVDLLLYFCHSSVIGSTMAIGVRSRNAYHWPSSRRQLAYRITHRLAEVVHLFSIHSPAEGSTNVGAEQPELDVILFIGHCVLALRERGAFRHRRGGTLPGPW